jgi:hypothetical protein
MTDPQAPSPRGSSGRFVSRKTEAPATPPVSDAQLHPAAKMLFGWTEHKRAGAFIFWFLALASVLLLAADFLIARKDYFDFAEGAGFYGLFGFSVFTLIVMAGWPLGWILRRRADFYHPPEDVPDHTDPAIEANPSIMRAPGDHP